MSNRCTQVFVALVLIFVIGQPGRGAPPARTDQYGDPLPAGVVARLGTTRLTLGSARFLTFSPDGRYLAAHNGMEDLHVWDVASGNEVLGIMTPSFAGFGTGWRPLAFSPDSKALALACRDDKERFSRMAMVRIWEVASGEVLHSFGSL